jgi:hypothetical protein
MPTAFVVPVMVAKNGVPITMEAGTVSDSCIVADVTVNVVMVEVLFL